MATSRRTIATTLAGVAIATLMLAGCTSGGSGDDAGGSGGSGDSGAASSSQTTEEACAVLKGGVEDTYAELEASLEDIRTDPGKAAAAVGSLGDAFEETAADVTNEDVRATVDTVVEALRDFSEQVEVLAESPDTVNPDAITGASETLREGFTKLGATCP